MAREAIIGKVISKVTFKINDLTGTKKASEKYSDTCVFTYIYMPMNIHTYTYIYMYEYIYMQVSIYVLCVYIYMSLHSPFIEKVGDIHIQ